MKKQGSMHSFLFLLFLVPMALGAQEFHSLEDITAYALENNLDYRKALWDAAKAAKDREGLLSLDDTSFSASSGYDDQEEWSGSAGVTVPLIDQISVSGTVYDDSTGQLGVSFSPLNHSDDRQQRDIAWQKAAALAKETAVKTENSALSALLDWMVLASQATIQGETALVRETIYRDERVRYEAGESTLDDVREALVDWTEARTLSTGLQSSLREKEADLTAVLNGSPGAMQFPLITSEVLERERDLLRHSIVPEEGDPLWPYAVLAASLDRAAAEQELKDTWIFDPSLTVESRISLGEVDPSWDVSAQLSFSLQDWQREEKEELRTDLEISRQEVAQQKQESLLAYRQALLALESTQQNREVARLEREQAEDLYGEAQFLYERGEYSQAEREDAALAFRTAETSYFSALAGEFLAWREMLLYLPEE